MAEPDDGRGAAVVKQGGHGNAGHTGFMDGAFRKGHVIKRKARGRKINTGEPGCHPRQHGKAGLRQPVIQLLSGGGPTICPAVDKGIVGQSLGDRILQGRWCREGQELMRTGDHRCHLRCSADPSDLPSRHAKNLAG